MKSDIAYARIAGTLFLVAMISSLAGAAILEPALVTPDAPLGFGVVLELVDALAVLGIAVVLLPVLQPRSETVAFGYFGLRILEAASLTAAALLPVTVRSMPGTSALLVALRGDILTVLVPLFFMIGSVFLYWLLFRHRLVPRFISIWGFAAVLALFVGNIAPMSMEVGFVFAAPIILNEIFLGIWLIARGFERSTDD